MTPSEEMEEMGMTISMMGAELLATKKELKGAQAALEEAQQQLSEAKEINAKGALDALFKDETEVERKLAEAQQTLVNLRAERDGLKKHRSELVISNTELQGQLLQAQQTIAELAYALKKYVVVNVVTGEGNGAMKALEKAGLGEGETQP